ncbi:MAG: hypothetical protein Q8M02_14010 [Candidatus Didemnitutus sp.]|nr:hypothetical protein [Candidatus Didemnitutus sp.]
MSNSTNLRRRVGWIALGVGIAASLSAQIVSSWPATPRGEKQAVVFSALGSGTVNGGSGSQTGGNNGISGSANDNGALPESIVLSYAYVKLPHGQIPMRMNASGELLCRLSYQITSGTELWLWRKGTSERILGATFSDGAAILADDVEVAINDRGDVAMVAYDTTWEKILLLRPKGSNEDFVVALPQLIDSVPSDSPHDVAINNGGVYFTLRSSGDDWFRNNIVLMTGVRVELPSVSAFDLLGTAAANVVRQHYHQNGEVSKLWSAVGRAIFVSHVSNSGHFIGSFRDVSPYSLFFFGKYIEVDGIGYPIRADGWHVNGIPVDFYPHAVNEAGTVVGSVGGATVIYDAVSRTITGGVADFWPLGIDGRGAILGSSRVLVPLTESGSTTTRYLPARLGVGFDIDELSYFETDLINENGMIAGQMLDMENQESGFLLVPAGLYVDANRDGQITPAHGISTVEDALRIDETSPTKPFRFWINDDDDNGDDKRSAADDIPLPEGDGKRDSENNKVDGIRDLEDFFPVFLDIKQLLTVLPQGANDFSYYLKHEDSALGVVFTSYTRTQAFDYLRGAPSGLDTGFGPTLAQKADEATVTKITAEGVNISLLSTAFFDRIKNNSGGVLLVEANKATTKPLVLEVRKGSQVIAELKLELKIDQVETMFRYVNLRSFANGTPIASNNQGPGYGSTRPTAAPNDPFSTAANRKNMVFVHGYNVNGEGARGASATAFKRFYWSGSKAKFYAVLWRGDDGQGAGIAPAGATPDYHRNVGHAWQQGPLFRDFLGTLEGDTAIMAHSLGNGVTKVALTRARDPNNPARLVPASKPATVKHYFAVDSALPLEATSASDITTESKSRMRHSWWAEYDTLERLWPTHWHELFEGTGDGREGLTWQNVFANLEVGTNFYSSGEEVLANPVNDGMPVLEPLFFAGLRAWIAQEKHKGGNGPAAPFFRSWTAGWVENEEWYVPIVPTPPFGSPQKRRRFASEAQNVAAPNGVPTSALATEPFFQRFQRSESGGFYPGYQGSRLHAPVGDTNADDEARKLVTVAKCLGEAIPALSYPQGSNEATRFEADGMGGNFNLNTSDFKNGWPASRGSDTNWKHSDCLDVSYIFHFEFYDRMKTDGGLQ